MSFPVSVLDFTQSTTVEPGFYYTFAEEELLEGNPAPPMVGPFPTNEAAIEAASAFLVETFIAKAGEFGHEITDDDVTVTHIKDDKHE